jgi:hypothetical protein
MVARPELLLASLLPGDATSPVVRRLAKERRAWEQITWRGAGTIAVPHGWGHREPCVGWQVAASLPGANVNLLHDPSLTATFTGIAAVNNTWVAVAAVP